MKEIAKLASSLDDLDKEAWLEIVGSAELETEGKISSEVDEGGKAGMKVWMEIFPFVQIIRLGLASDTLSRVERSQLVNAILMKISGLLSPVDLAGIALSAAFKSLHGSQGGIIPMIVPLPFGAMELEKKDETQTVV